MRWVTLSAVLLAVCAMGQSATACPMQDQVSGSPPNFRQPANGKIFKHFGIQFHELLNTNAMHTGVDFDGVVDDPIFAVMNGEVIEAGQKGYLGNYVLVEHGDGVRTAYGHLRRFLVSPGDCVHAGQEIAKMGSTGLSSGPHLHFEAILSGRFVDPEPLIFYTEP